VTWAANFASGGTYDNLQPRFDYLAKLHKSSNVLRVVGTTPYAQFVKGEVPIWINYVNDGLRAKFVDGLGDDVEVISPTPKGIRQGSTGKGVEIAVLFPRERSRYRAI